MIHSRWGGEDTSCHAIEPELGPLAIASISPLEVLQGIGMGSSAHISLQVSIGKAGEFPGWLRGR